MRDEHAKPLIESKENDKEIYTAPIITKHQNLRLITKDPFSYDYSGGVDPGDTGGPPPPP